MLELALRLGRKEEVGSTVNLKVEAFPTATASATVTAPFDPSPALEYIVFNVKNATEEDLGITAPLLPEELEVEPYNNDTPPKIKTGQGSEIFFFNWNNEFRTPCSTLQEFRTG